MTLGRCTINRCSSSYNSNGMEVDTTKLNGSSNIFDVDNRVGSPNIDTMSKLGIERSAYSSILKDLETHSKKLYNSQDISHM